MKTIIYSILSAGLLMPLDAMAQQDTASLQQPVDVGANVNFSREQSTAAVSVITSASTNKRSAKNIGNSILGQGNGLVSLLGSGNYVAQNPTFYVRGLQSLSGSTPLVLVDGIERDMKYVSAEEVESVSILKDAAATALYGYKGANGAIPTIASTSWHTSRSLPTPRPMRSPSTRLMPTTARAHATPMKK